LDPKELHELIELISRSNLQSFELEREGLRLKLVKQQGAERAARPAAVPALEASEPAPAAATTGEPAAVTDGLLDFNAPIVGTFYRAPSPAAPNFVEVGSRVARGQVLCIVEAMKVMNEIESEVDGEIVEILATNGQPVEYGEVLFRLRPL
jgi:acetyl-CoA carboxylase biotin carboxyl carrier protein